MSHLPECPVPDMQVSRGALHPDDTEANCICEELRACEQRVLDEAWAAVAAQFRDGKAIGGPIEDLDDLRAVFDALREEQK